ncbi:MAG TPA: ABC transporter permease subunit [Acidobacteriaceae bacterium]|jgi:peptide/nickel transport system permease protein|nr:ABC transporter permease subunit [Acidobacteriaceae bacterium]
MKTAMNGVRWLARTFAIVLLVILGSTILVRFAPGYLSDAREMDSRYASEARTELSAEAARSHSIPQMLGAEIGGWARGDFGTSRQYQVPVSTLIEPRLAISGKLLLRGIGLAWMVALCAALISSAGRNPSMFRQAPATVLLAIPTAALATVCLLVNSGGPVLVMALLLAARDFKFLDRALRRAWMEPHVLQARAQGVRTGRLLAGHIAPSLAPHLGALASLSIVTALSALVPVEVLFDVPGVGELAWNAALNRDLPVLLAVMFLMAIAVTCSGMATPRAAEWESA